MCRPRSSLCDATPLTSRLATSSSLWHAVRVPLSALTSSSIAQQQQVHPPTQPAHLARHAARSPRYATSHPKTSPRHHVTTNLACSLSLLTLPRLRHLHTDLTTQWWASFAQTLAGSKLTTDATFTAYGLDVDQRTIHAIVHIFEPAGSQPTAHLCLSRTKFDSTAPLPPLSVRTCITQAS